MALFDRNDRNHGYRGGEMNRGRGFAGRGGYGPSDEHLRRDYENRSTMDAGADYRGMNRGMGDRGREREGLWANSWSDGAWTADAADRTGRDWHLGRGGGPYDRDVRPAQGGWRAGGMTDRDWNLGGGDRDWGHNWGSGMGGYRGMDRGGFVDRAQNAVRRGWDRVEETFDRDDDRHLGYGAMRGGTSWAGNYDRDFNNARGDSGVRGYRDDEGHYGVMPAHNDDTLARPRGGGYGYGMSGGMSRYAADYDRADYDRGGMDAHRGWKSRPQTDTGDPFGDRQSRTPIRMVNEGRMGRYDNGFRGRNWF